MKNKAYLLAFLIVGLASCQNPQKVKQQQYYAEGAVLYKTHCANCHQIDGTGLQGLYPPIAKSDYLTGNNKNTIICMIKNGFTAPMVVNGKEYKQAMPANKRLEALEIAEIMTYINNTWGNETIMTTIEEVDSALVKCPTKY
jgi:mono/diheme cytochrome c family protein